MNEKPLTIKKRGDDGTKVVSVRMRRDLLDSLDHIAQDSNYSRNEIINIILEYGVENIQIQ